MKRKLWNTYCILLFSAAIMAAGCGNIKNELAGNARPDAGIVEQVPPIKTFNASYESTWKATQDVLDGHGILFEADKTNGKIVTEDKTLQNITGWQAMFAGSNYKAKQYIDVKKAAENQTSVKYTARFTKEFATILATTNKEYPETENMLRKAFFDDLDKLLATPPPPVAAAIPAPAPAAKAKKIKKL
jgi:hypothetical protein